MKTYSWFKYESAYTYWGSEYFSNKRCI